MTGYVYTSKDIMQEVDTLTEKLFYIYNKKNDTYYFQIGSGFDIETTRVNTKLGVRSYCYHWQFSFGEHTVMGRNLETAKNFFYVLSEKLKTKMKNGKKTYLMILVANLGYEWQFCKKYFYEIGISDWFGKKERDPLKFNVNNILEFREVIGLWGHSLSDIAVKHTVTQKLKGDLDYDEIILSNTEITEKEKQYCINDVRILAELGEKIFKTYYGNKPEMPLTSTGTIRAKIKKRMGYRIKYIKKEVQENLPEEEDFYFLRKYCFKGGISGTNSLYARQKIENVICADLTSDYPAQMLHELFPYGKCSVVDNDDFMKNEYKPYMAYVVLTDVKPKTSHAFISSSKCVNEKELCNRNSVLDNNRILYADKIELVITDVEYIGLQQAYSFHMDVKKCWQFTGYKKLPKYLVDTLKEQYVIKNKLKREGKTDSQDYKDAKAFINGIFGMCATAIFPIEKILDGTPECKIIKSENKKPFAKAIQSMFLSPFIAFWVTSYARNILIDVITKFPDLILQYDTDSVYYKEDGADELTAYLKQYNEKIYRMNKEIMPDDPDFYDLGGWDFDKPYRYFKGLGSKRYLLEKQDGTYKVVVCGCRKGTIEKEIAYQYQQTGKKPDMFDFFNDKMKIAPERSGKLDSKYYDDDVGFIDYQDRNGDKERIEIRSCIVLEPVGFSMTMTKNHVKLINYVTTCQRFFENSDMYKILETCNFEKY